MKTASRHTTAVGAILGPDSTPPTTVGAILGPGSTPPTGIYERPFAMGFQPVGCGSIQCIEFAGLPRSYSLIELGIWLGYKFGFGFGIWLGFGFGIWLGFGFGIWLGLGIWLGFGLGIWFGFGCRCGC